MNNPLDELPPIVRQFISYMSNELMRSPLTVMAYRSDLMAYIRFITNDKPATFDAATITTGDIRLWMAEQAKRGRSISTLRRSLQSIRSFFVYLKKLHIIQSDPTEPIELPSRKHMLPEYVTEEEMERILAQLPESPIEDFLSKRNKLIINMLYTTGMRQAEMLNIKDSDFMRDGSLRIVGKGDKQRIVPIPGALQSEIKEYLSARERQFPELPEDHTFLIHRGRNMTKSKLYSIVRESLDMTSSRKKSPHVLRHTFATAMINNGADINTVKEILGHSSLATTQIYTHISFKDMKESYDKAHPRASKNENS